MAKPNEKVLVKIREDLVYSIEIWIDNPISIINDLESIEGIHQISTVIGNVVYISVDPRYNVEDVANEINDLLIIEVPDIFKD